jgi:hypothetical protein
MKVSCDVCREPCKQPVGSIVVKCGAFARKGGNKDSPATPNKGTERPVKTTKGSRGTI